MIKNLIRIIPKLFLTYLFLLNTIENRYLYYISRDTSLVVDMYNFMSFVSFGIACYVLIEVFYYILEDLIKNIFLFFKRRSELKR